MPHIYDRMKSEARIDISRYLRQEETTTLDDTTKLEDLHRTIETSTIVMKKVKTLSTNSTTKLDFGVLVNSWSRKKKHLLFITY